MLVSAQNLIDKLLAADNIGYANELLVDLYMTIPRKMRNVRDHIAADMNQLHSIIGNEQDLLDTMSANVETSTAQAATTYPFVLAEATEADARRLYGLYNGQPGRLIKVTRTNEPDMPADIELLWHGSGESNWYHILREGLRIRPATAYLTGAAFGNGIYFADYYQKSKNYCSGGLGPDEINDLRNLAGELQRRLKEKTAGQYVVTVGPSVSFVFLLSEPGWE